MGGAWSNRLFRLPVGEEVFALKELRNPWKAENWLSWIEAAFVFERLAIAAGISAPEPVANPGTDSAVAWVERQDGQGELAVRLHRWVQGAPCPPGPVEPAVAGWAGETLARLHDLGIHPADPQVFPRLSTIAAESWTELTEVVRQQDADLAVALEALDPWVERALGLAHLAVAEGATAVMSHGDIDQKNIILTRNGPVLCDWDVAAPWVPTWELADVALSMAANTEVGLARRVVASYELATGRPVRLRPWDLGRSLMNGLDWLVFNVERSLGLRPGEPEEVELSKHLVLGLLRTYPRGVDLAEALPGQLHG
ncbi:MAG: phosphotransferase family protein [Acidimicrobiales bacterium]